LQRRRWLRRSLLGLLVLSGIAAAAWVSGALPPLGPIGGGRLRGESAPLPQDWSFVDRIGEVQVETRLGFLPWSVTTWCLEHEGVLYLPARNCLSKRWVNNLLAHPEVRVRVAGRIYELRARREENSEIGQALLEQMLEKYLGILAKRPSAADTVSPEDADRAYLCAFRMEPRR
jgi:hypothetical protein